MYNFKKSLQKRKERSENFIGRGISWKAALSTTTRTVRTIVLWKRSGLRKD